MDVHSMSVHDINSIEENDLVSFQTDHISTVLKMASVDNLMMWLGGMAAWRRGKQLDLINSSEL